MSDEWTDDSGIVYTRPERSDYRSDVEWMRAVCAWNDMRSAAANKAFAEGFNRALRTLTPIASL
jgi:hypothetical protein